MAFRERLRQQLNVILQTRESARGLIVNMSDVLFDSGKATLRPGAREKLAKVAGIVLAYPGLNLEVEGHTDSVGSADYNLDLVGAARQYRALVPEPAGGLHGIDRRARLREGAAGGDQRHGHGPSAESPRRADRLGLTDSIGRRICSAAEDGAIGLVFPSYVTQFKNPRRASAMGR